MTINLEVAPSGHINMLTSRIAHLEAGKRELDELKGCINFMIEQNMETIDLKISRNATVECDSWNEILKKCYDAARYPI